MLDCAMGYVYLIISRATLRHHCQNHFRTKPDRSRLRQDQSHLKEPEHVLGAGPRRRILPGHTSLIMLQNRQTLLFGRECVCSWLRMRDDELCPS
jgi:hypothetical protein